MSLIAFEESGMTFTFEEEECYRIEKDSMVNHLERVKCCECVSAIHDIIVFIEAKHSAPKCSYCELSKVTYNGASLPDRWSIKTNFDKFIEEISLKFQDSFFFVKASLEGWHGSDKKGEVASKLKKLYRDKLKFVLILTTAADDWLPNLNDSLKINMRHFLNAWNIPDTSIKVVNPDKAKRLNIPIIVQA